MRETLVQQSKEEIDAKKADIATLEASVASLTASLDTQLDALVLLEKDEDEERREAEIDRLEGVSVTRVLPFFSLPPCLSTQFIRFTLYTRTNGVGHH